jgi:hypothetical protein
VIAVGGLSIQTASANGDMIWAFSLNGNSRRRIAQFGAPNPPPKQVSFNVTGLIKGEVPIVKTDAVKIADYAFSPARITGARRTGRSRCPVTRRVDDLASERGDRRIALPLRGQTVYVFVKLPSNEMRRYLQPGNGGVPPADIDTTGEHSCVSGI